ncbi:DUF4124 domain-containing protein [Variovorax robiniae]|uniref:DUF4124 domain-containing protein n=1 Tax=Variovorax robiniae TaxID=1836199 RepID=A0ABU8XB79_9BURK
MRRFLVIVALSLFGPLCSAEVNRCTDAAGQVSYTDGKCPASTKVTRLNLPEPMVVNRGDSDVVPLVRPAEPRPTAPPPTPMSPPQAAAPAPPAPVIGDYGGDPVVADYGYPYAGGYRPAPPRNLGPRFRKCDASGCSDTQGNHYDRTGTLNRYKSLDGRTCTPTGTTVVCR